MMGKKRKKIPKHTYKNERKKKQKETKKMINRVERNKEIQKQKKKWIDCLKESII